MLTRVFQFASLRASLQLEGRAERAGKQLVSIRVAASVFATKRCTKVQFASSFNSRRCERLCNSLKGLAVMLTRVFQFASLRASLQLEGRAERAGKQLVSIRVAASVFATLPIEWQKFLKAVSIRVAASVFATIGNHPILNSGFNSRRCERLCNIQLPLD